MKRFTSYLALAAFVVALAAPLALAQGSSTPSTTPAPPAAPATEPMKVAPAEKPLAKKATMHAETTRIDINTATREELMKLPGVTDPIADKIVAGRPYKSKSELGTRKIVGPKTYAKIRTLIVAKQMAGAAK